MQPNEPVGPPETHKYSLQMAMLVFLTLFLGGALLFMVSRLNTPAKEENSTQASQKPQQVVTGSMKVVKSGANEFQVVVDSQSHDIVGFDALLVYDAGTLTVNKVTSVDSNFQVTSFKKPGYISITATKSLSQKGTVVLKGTPVVSVQVQITNPAARMSLISVNGNESTKMIDAQSQKLFPALN